MSSPSPEIDAGRSTPARRPGSLLHLITPAGSAVTAAVAVWWLLVPDTHPLAAESPVVLRLLSPVAAAGILLGLSAITLALGLLTRRLRSLAPVVTGTGVLYALVLIIGYQGSRLTMMAGYTMALVIPVGLVLLVAQSLRRYPALRPLVILLVAGGVAWAGLGGVLDVGTLRMFAHVLASYLPAALTQAVPALLLGTAAAWLARGWRGIAAHDRGIRLATFVREHRAVFTLVAAASPLPYVLLRLTWLTPWPILEPGDLDPSLRLWGLLLGAAAVLGSILTLGLIRPWGEVFPRWVPFLAGRPVPIAAAAVPGFTIAAILQTSGVSMLFSQFPGSSRTLGETIFTALVFPFWLWAPALALAVAGYVGHRRWAR